MVPLDPAALREWGFLPLRAEPGTIWRGDDGECVRVNRDGSCDRVPPAALPHSRGAAADPCLKRRRRP